MLAYSSIAHAGYVLIGVTRPPPRPARRPSAAPATLFYLLVYAFMAIGAFTVVTVVARRRDDARHSLSDYRRLATQAARSRRPAHLVPARAGRRAAHGRVRRQAVGVRRGRRRARVLLVLIGMLTAVVAAFVYLRIVVTMYDTEGEEDAPRAQRSSDRGDGRARAHHRRRLSSSPSGSLPAGSSSSPGTPPCPLIDARRAQRDLGTAGTSAGSAFGAGRGRARRARARRAHGPARWCASSMSLCDSEKSKSSRSSRGRGSTMTSTPGGTLRSSSSKRWFRAMREARHHDVERRAHPAVRRPRRRRCSTKTRSTGPASACQSGTLSTTPPSTRRRPSCSIGGNTPGSAALAEQRRLERAARRTRPLRPVEVGRDHPERRPRGRSNVRAGSAWSMSSREPVVGEEVASRRTTFQARASRFPGKTWPVRIDSHTSAMCSTP